jgi:hypothetical protein
MKQSTGNDAYITILLSASRFLTTMAGGQIQTQRAPLFRLSGNGGRYTDIKIEHRQQGNVKIFLFPKCGR